MPCFAHDPIKLQSYSNGTKGSVRFSFWFGFEGGACMHVSIESVSFSAATTNEVTIEVRVSAVRDAGLGEAVEEHGADRTGVMRTGDTMNAGGINARSSSPGSEDVTLLGTCRFHKNPEAGTEKPLCRPAATRQRISQSVRARLLEGRQAPRPAPS